MNFFKKDRNKVKTNYFVIFIIFFFSQLTSPTSASFNDSERIDLKISFYVEDEIAEVVEDKKEVVSKQVEKKIQKKSLSKQPNEISFTFFYLQTSNLF